MWRTIRAESDQRHGGVYGAGMARRKLYRADLAALAGIKVDSLQRANPPAPDGRDIDGSHARPWWWESTAKRWLAARPGKGWRRSQGAA
jgi:hypothetical protein